MPTVPRVTGPEVAPQGPPNAMLSTAGGDAAAFGGIEARQYGEAAVIAQRVKDRSDIDSVFRAETALKTDYLAFERDELNKQGANAAGAAERTKAWWEKAASNYGADLSPEARRAFEQRASQVRLTGTETLMRHAQTQANRSLVESANATAQTSANLAVSDPTPERITEALRTIDTSTRATAKVLGWSDDKRAQEALTLTSAMHKNIVLTVAETNPEAAQTMFREAVAAGQISGLDQKVITPVLKAEVLNYKAAETANKWAALPYAEQLVKVSEIKDPELRSKTELHVKQNQSMVQAAHAASEKASADAAWQLVGQGKKVPESVLSQMDGRERVQLQEFLRQRAEHNATGPKPIRTNPEVHAKLWDLMVRDPKAFTEVRLPAYSMAIAGTDLEQLFKAQQSIRNPTAGRDPIKFQTKVSSTIEQMDLVGAKKAEDRGAFKSAANKAYEAFVARTGKPPDEAQEDKIIDELIVKVPSGHWYAPDKPAYKSKGTAAEDAAIAAAGGKPAPAAAPAPPVNTGERVPIAVISGAERAQIQEYLVREKLPLTEEYFQRAYQKMHGTARTGNF